MIEEKIKGIFLNSVFGGFRKYLTLAALVGTSIMGCSGSSNSTEKADAVVYDTSAWGGSGFSSPDTHNPDTSLKETKPENPLCYVNRDGDDYGSSVGVLSIGGECPSGSVNNKVDCDDNYFSLSNECPKGDVIASSSDADVSTSIDTLTDIDTYTGKKIVEITAGYLHACARTITNEAYCWGYNGKGPVSGNNPKELYPVKVNGLEGYTITRLSAGNNYTCAIADNKINISEKGVVLCWGDLGVSDIGDNTDVNEIQPFGTVPTKIEGLDGIVATQLATGGIHMLILTTKGIYGLGYNHWGALTKDLVVDTPNFVATPTLVPVAGTGLEGKTIIDVAANSGASASFVVTSGGEGYSFGGNFGGILGIGEVNIQTIYNNPIEKIKNLDGIKVTEISTKFNSVFGLLSNGKAAFWGNNDIGQALLGENNKGQIYIEPIVLDVLNDDLVEKGVSVTGISSSEKHAFFLLSNGQAGGSGYNGYGQLGTNNTNDVYSKEKVTWLYGEDQKVKQVAAGRDFTLVRLNDGSVEFMGRGIYGVVGNGTEDNVYVPTLVLFPTD